MSNARKIIHCDCDCFYASIEMRDNPELSSLPIAVGGSPQRRGVVATCNYEARRFGIHSAMAAATARRLCPDLIIIKPDMDKYRLASEQMHEIFKHYTKLIEPLSLDEAFLDVSECTLHGGSATLIASEIRARIEKEIGITVSAGIAPNKFLAKIASDWNKPNGQFVVLPEHIDDFVQALSVKKIYGVGKVTAARLHKLNIKNCGDLRAWSLEDLTEKFGDFGNRLFKLCRGIDTRPVQPSRIRKSVSVETTFASDLPDFESCLNELPALLERLEKRLAKIQDQYEVTKQICKIKFLDFVSTTVEVTSKSTKQDVFEKLLQQGFERGNRPVRLLGIGVGVAPVKLIAIESGQSDEKQAPTHQNQESQLALSLEQQSG